MNEVEEAIKIIEKHGLKVTSTDNREYLNFLEILEGPKLMVGFSTIAAFGVEKANFIHEMIRWWYFYKKKGQLQKDGSFYLKQEKIETNLLIQRKRQTRYLEYFIKNGVLEVKKKGLPAKNFYKINIDIFAELCNKPNKITDVTKRPNNTGYYETSTRDIMRHQKEVISKKVITNNISLKDKSFKENDFSEEKSNNPIFFKENKNQEKIILVEENTDDFKKRENNPLVKNQTGDFKKEECTSLVEEDPIVVGIFNSCNSYGKPFTTHKKTNKNGEETKIYQKSIFAIKSLLKTETPENLVESRKRFFEFLKSGACRETHINPDFVLWNPSLANFFRPDRLTRKSYKKMGFPKIKSLYHEFKPGMHPEIKFGKLIADSYPEITKILQDSLFRADGKFTTKDTNLLRNAASKIGAMHEILSEETRWCFGMGLNSTVFALKLIDFIKSHTWYSSKISPGLLCSDRLISDDFYNWLESEGIIKGKTKKNTISRYNLYSKED